MNLLDATPETAAHAIADWVVAKGEPRYRGQQILRRLWLQPVGSWHDALELPLRVRDALAEELPVPRPRLVTRQLSSDGTVKYLWDFGRDGSVESVLIPEGRRRTVCISSQSGCALGCVFCATGRMGFRRHLAAWEITAQVRELMLGDDPCRPTNVVFMGMGEPLHNWSNVDRALTILNSPRGLGIGARRITVSTVGLIPGLAKLAARPEQFTVAVSLHAADSETRARLMPVERKYPLPEVMRALAHLRRRVTFEYVMIAGVNDRPQDAEALVSLARPLVAHVNLLPLHPGGASELRSSNPSTMRRFAASLRASGVETSLRRSRGLDINAACGQLRLDAEARRQIEPEHHGDVQEEAAIRGR